MKSSHVVATPNSLSVGLLWNQLACRSLFPFRFSPSPPPNLRQYRVQHHPTSTRDRFTWWSHVVLFESFNTIHICSTDFVEAWSPVRQRVAVANAFTRQRYNIIRYRSLYSIFYLSRMRACMYLLYFYLYYFDRNDTRFGLRCFYFVISSPMLRKVLSRNV